MKPVRFDLSYILPASPERVWPILADTERLNRSLGLPPARAEVLPGLPVRRARVTARLGGIPLEWIEEPFRFEEPRFYWVERKMTGGPIAEFNGGMRFHPVPEGTEVRVESEFVPANSAGSLLIRGVCAKTRRDCDRLMRDVAAHLRGERAAAFPEGVGETAPDKREVVLSRIRSRAADWSADPAAQRLCDWLATAGDSDLVRIRPFVLARAWNLDRYGLLRTCLRAAALGVLDTSWDLLCPNCQGAPNRWSRLRDVRAGAHCDDCQISFDADFDRAVEVTFRPNANIRTLDELIYCSGGPRNTPHLVAQAVVASGGSETLVPVVPPGRYRLRNLTAELSRVLLVEEEGVRSEAEAVFAPTGVAVDVPGSCAPGPLRMRVSNRTGSPQQIILEQLFRTEDRATAAVVAVFQEFRELFDKEALSPDVQLGIRTLPLMFTDLKGSTSLYSRLGDAGAYALVRDHFSLLKELVARHGGGLVKTIGDAVMAAFPTTEASVRCALEIHAELAKFNHAHSEPVYLKVGLHQGPCIATGSYDDRLDYFGSTVNLAARIHEQSRGDDVVVSRAILADREAAALLAGVRKEAFTAELRGIGEVELTRLYPQPAG